MVLDAWHGAHGAGLAMLRGLCGRWRGCEAQGAQAQSDPCCRGLCGVVGGCPPPRSFPYALPNAGIMLLSSQLELRVYSHIWFSLSRPVPPREARVGDQALLGSGRPLGEILSLLSSSHTLPRAPALGQAGVCTGQPQCLGDGAFNSVPWG